MAELFTMDAIEFAYREGFHAGQYALFQKTYWLDKEAWERSISKRKQHEYSEEKK